jgi:hypothetical protein
VGGASLSVNHNEISQIATKPVKSDQSGSGPDSPAQADSGQGTSGPGGTKPSTPAAGLGPAAIATAIALIAVYIAMLFILMTLRGDKEWDRLVYLLSGFEALVFAGAGALFGTTIQRANVTAARSDAADAKQDAADAKQTAQAERDRAQQAEKDAEAGRFLAAAVKAKADTRASGSVGRVRGSRPETSTGATGTGADGLDADLLELSILASRVMPDI